MPPKGVALAECGNESGRPQGTADGNRPVRTGDSGAHPQEA